MLGSPTDIASHYHEIDRAHVADINLHGIPLAVGRLILEQARWQAMN